MSVLALLTQEIEALRRVLATLGAERAALDERSPDALLAASNAKAEAVAIATSLEQQRQVQTAADPAAPTAAATGLINELKTLAAECRQQNDVNGLLIRGQRRRVEGSLNVLRGGRAATDTYGRDGETRLIQGSRTPLASY